MPPEQHSTERIASRPEIARRYDAALAAFLAKAEADPYILAVVLLGSLSYDVVWERSDIDLAVIVQEGKHRAAGYTLVEDDITIHAWLKTRGEFKKSAGSRRRHDIPTFASQQRAHYLFARRDD